MERYKPIFKEAKTPVYDFKTKKFIGASNRYIKDMEDVIDELAKLSSVEKVKKWMINNNADFDLQIGNQKWNTDSDLD